MSVIVPGKEPYALKDNLDSGCRLPILRRAGKGGLRKTQSGIGEAQWRRILRELLPEFYSGVPHRGGTEFSYLAQDRSAAGPQNARATLQVEEPPHEVSAVRNCI